MMKWLRETSVAFGLVLAFLVAYSYGQTVVSTRALPSAYQYKALGDASGNYTPIAGVAGQKIQVWNILLTTGANTTVEFKSGSTTLTNAMTINGMWQGGGPWGRSAGDTSPPLFETAAGQGFVIVTGTPTQVSGQITYTTYP